MTDRIDRVTQWWEELDPKQRQALLAHPAVKIRLGATFVLTERQREAGEPDLRAARQLAEPGSLILLHHQAWERRRQAALHDTGRVHHVGSYQELED